MKELSDKQPFSDQTPDTRANSSAIDSAATTRWVYVIYLFCLFSFKYIRSK